jgi:hypothetical protein
MADKEAQELPTARLLRTPAYDTLYDLNLGEDSIDEQKELGNDFPVDPDPNPEPNRLPDPVPRPVPVPIPEPEPLPVPTPNPVPKPPPLPVPVIARREKLIGVNCGFSLAIVESFRGETTGVIFA